MIDRTPPNEMPPADERNVREVRSSSGASWFIAGLAVVVVVVGGIFVFGDELGFNGADTTVNMQPNAPAQTTPQSEPSQSAPQAAPDNNSTGQSTPSPTAPASE
ncbi:MAG: hypothetical protein AB7O39_10795 [Flavobacteriaceae bacterium]